MFNKDGDGNDGNDLLSSEKYIIRRVEVTTKKRPKLKLTEKQRSKLLKEELDYCTRAYISRFTVTKAVTELDSLHDLEGEAYLFFNSCLDKFDRSRLGKISKVDKEGKGNEKTLNFYFKNFFNNRVNFIACDNVREAKKAGQIIDSDNSMIEDDLFESHISTPDIFEDEIDSEIYDALLLGIKKLSWAARDYFKYKIQQDLSAPEVRKRLGKSYNVARIEYENFLKNFKDEFGKMSGRVLKRGKKE